MSKTDTTSYMDALEKVAVDVIRPAAVEIDKNGAFPRAAMDALSKAGLLGLVSAREVGGLGGGMREASMVIKRVAQECASTAMVLAMHYNATAVIEAHGSMDVRKAIAVGKHITTLAFSEFGSRSHFWSPVSTAVGNNGTIQLDAAKSWVTSAGEADSYVWSSKPLEAEEASTIWLVSSNADGLTVAGAFDGLGLRGNASSPVKAEKVSVEHAAMLGPDGGGFDIMMSVVLPYFHVTIAAASIGIMEAATQKAAEHVSGIKLEHLGSALRDLPTIRAYIARMRIKTDLINALMLDTLDAAESGREDTMLRILEIKAAAAEAATEVTDLAMRVCGGAAFRKDMGLERNFRDARAATVMAPTTDVLYDFIGKAVCGMPLF